jgi:hypothetical protein
MLHVQKKMQIYLSSLAEAIKYVLSPIIFIVIKQRSLWRGKMDLRKKKVVKYVIWIKSTEYEMSFISLRGTGSEHLSLWQILNELSLNAHYTSDGGRNA